MYNAGNIRSPDGSFRSYDTPEQGYMALLNDLTAKVSGNSPAMRSKLGNDYTPTLTNLISVYAPPSENNTPNYIDFVSKQTGLNPNQPLTRDDVKKIAPAIVTMEQGQQGAKIYKQYADAGTVQSDASPEAPQTFNVRLPNGQLLQNIPVGTTKEQIKQKLAAKGITFDEQPAQPVQEQPSILEDIVKSTVYRGIPEGLAAVTPLGYGLNIVRGVSDATRWLAGKAYKASTGEELPNYAENPVPTSSDILRSIVEHPVEGYKLYEPKTTAGRYANTIAQFGSGGAVSGIPLRNTILAAVASETAGEAIPENSDWQIPARIAGAVLGGYAGNKLGDINKSVVNTAKNITKSGIASTNALNEAAGQWYKAAEDAGGMLKPQAMQKVVADIKGKVLATTPEGKAFGSNTVVDDALSRLDNISNLPVSLKGLDEIDDKLQGMVSKAATAGDKESVRALKTIQGELRNASSNVSPEDIINPQAFEAWRNGDALYAVKMKSKQINDIFSNAYNTQVPSTGIKTGFRQLAKSIDKYGKQGWTDEEIAAIREAAKSGVATDLLQTVGGRLVSGFTGGIAGSTAGPVGAVGGAIAGEVAGFPMRATANKLQEARGAQVQRLLGDRENIQNLLKTNPNQALQQAFQAKKAAEMAKIAEKQVPPTLALPSAEAPLISTPSGIRPMTNAEWQASIDARNNARDLGIGRTEIKTPNNINVPTAAQASVKPSPLLLGEKPDISKQVTQVTQPNSIQPIAGLLSAPTYSVSPSGGAITQSERIILGRQAQKVGRQTSTLDQKVTDFERNNPPRYFNDIPPYSAEELANIPKNNMEGLAPRKAEIDFSKTSSTGKPQSLYTMIKNAGGLKDPQGELNHLGLNNLINSKGISLDDLGEKLQENGIFASRPSINEVLDLLDNSKGGKGIYSAGDIDRVMNAAENRTMRQANDASYLEHEASKLGIDTEGKTSKQLKDALTSFYKNQSGAVPESVTLGRKNIFNDALELPFDEGTIPDKTSIAELNKWLSKNSDKYTGKYVTMYHGTGENIPIMEKGLLPTSATRRRSFQSQSGYVYLANTPERAREFGNLANGTNNSKVYAVKVPIKELKSDLDQLRNLRSTGKDIGNSLAESLLYGGGARVKGAIPKYDIKEYNFDNPSIAGSVRVNPALIAGGVAAGAKAMGYGSPKEEQPIDKKRLRINIRPSEILRKNKR